MANVYEIKTSDIKKSRAKNMRYRGRVSIFENSLAKPYHGEFSVKRNVLRGGEEIFVTEIVNFEHGFLQNRKDSEGFVVPAYRTDLVNAEYFKSDLLHCENGSAVICDWGNWEECLPRP